MSLHQHTTRLGTARLLTNALNPFFVFTALYVLVALSLILLGAFAVLLGALALLGAPEDLLLTTLSMGLGTAAVAAVTSIWKASAHSTVAGHATAAGLLVLGALGLVFVPVLLAVLWSRVASGAHTPAQVLAGAGVGAAFALLFLA